jgi:hypothetical protein
MERKRRRGDAIWNRNRKERVYNSISTAVYTGCEYIEKKWKFDGKLEVKIYCYYYKRALHERIVIPVVLVFIIVRGGDSTVPPVKCICVHVYKVKMYSSFSSFMSSYHFDSLSRPQSTCNAIPNASQAHAMHTIYTVEQIRSK